MVDEKKRKWIKHDSEASGEKENSSETLKDSYRGAHKNLQHSMYRKKR